MIDQMAYNYQTGTNKLNYIADPYHPTSVDIEGQSANNYTYDAIGNLTQDVKGGLSSIAWNPYGKITQISKGTNGNLYYDYDAMGNRVKKNFTQSNDNADNTWYVRDASGNIMAIYSRKNYGTNQQLVLENYELYGSSRLGSLNLGMAVEGDYNLAPATGFTRSLGLKQYEISNHLGNVLTTFSDQRVFVANMSTTNTTALTPKLISAQDYYPFGMIMDGRSWNTDKVKFGFNGKENDNEVKGIGNQQDYGMRIYDTRIGKFLSVDPLADSYPWYTPYQFAGNMPISAIDLDGLEPWHINGNTTITDGSGTRQYNFSATVYGPWKDQQAAWDAGVSNSTPLYDTKVTGPIILNTSNSGGFWSNIRIPKLSYNEMDAYREPNLAGDGQPGEWKAQVNGLVNGINSLLHPIETFKDGVDAIEGLATTSYTYLLNSNTSAISSDFTSFLNSNGNTGYDALYAQENGATVAFSIALGMSLKLPTTSPTTSDGFLFRGFTMKTPFNIPVQRFGNLSIDRSDFWGIRIGTSKLTNRVFGAIRSEWNPLTQYTTGVIPKGTPIKFGIIGPQGLRYPGGSIQFIVPSKNVIKQSSKLISR